MRFPNVLAAAFMAASLASSSSSWEAAKSPSSERMPNYAFNLTVQIVTRLAGGGSAHSPSMGGQQGARPHRPAG